MADVKKDKTALDVVTPDIKESDIDQMESEIKFDAESPSGQVADSIIGTALKQFQGGGSEDGLGIFQKFASSPETISKATSLFGMDISKNRGVLSALSGLAEGIGGKEGDAGLDLTSLKGIQDLQQGEIKKGMEQKKDYDKQVGDFKTKQTALNTIGALANNPTAAGDMGIIFSYMKLLDPNSTVREGEYATARDAAGLPQRMVNLYNKLLNGQELGADESKQRDEFVNAAKTMYTSELKKFKKTRQEFVDRAGKLQIDSDTWIPDYSSQLDNNIAKTIDLFQNIANGKVKPKGELTIIKEKEKKQASPEQIALAEKIRANPDQADEEDKKFADEILGVVK